MREQLDQDLKDTLNATLNMLGTVERMYELGAAALNKADGANLQQLQALDREVDGMEERIEADCLRLIATQQPVARDLRQMGLILKCLTDIERMGDYVVHIADYSQKVEVPAEQQARLIRMMERLTEMSQTLRRAIADRDVDGALKTIGMDDEIDDLFAELQESLAQHIQTSPAYTAAALDLMRIGRAIERIGDHMENIAERIPYWVTGKAYVQPSSQPSNG